MIIEKTTLTEEEKRNAKSELELEVIKIQKQEKYISSFGEKFGYTTDFLENGQQIKKMDHIPQEHKDYIEQSILADVKEILSAVTKEDVARIINKLYENDDNVYISYSNCYECLTTILMSQRLAYEFYGLPNLDLVRLTEQKATELYPKESSENPEQDDSLPHIKQLKTMDRYYYTTDKVTSTIFSGKFPIGQIGRLKAESDKDNNKGKKADIIALVDFDELDGVKISRKLTAYDKLVWNACVNLYVQGRHELISVEQIYKAMGNSSKPNAKIQAEILETVETISRARVSIDTTEEHQLYPKYDKVKATFQLLPTATCTAFSRGRIVKNAIKILETPALYTFAENRKQVACLPSSILEVPVSKTKDNVALLDYLIQRISRMKSDKNTPRNILLDTLLAHCAITDKSKKSRLLSNKNGTLKRILDHFAAEKFIQKYDITERDIIITV